MSWIKQMHDDSFRLTRDEFIKKHGERNVDIFDTNMMEKLENELSPAITTMESEYYTDDNKLIQGVKNK